MHLLLGGFISSENAIIAFITVGGLLIILDVHAWKFIKWAVYSFLGVTGTVLASAVYFHIFEPHVFERFALFCCAVAIAVVLLMSLANWRIIERIVSNAIFAGFLLCTSGPAYCFERVKDWFQSRWQREAFKQSQRAK